MRLGESKGAEVKSVTLSVPISSNTREQLIEVSRKISITMTEVARRFIQEGIDRHNASSRDELMSSSLENMIGDPVIDPNVTWRGRLGLE